MEAVALLTVIALLTYLYIMLKREYKELESRPWYIRHQPLELPQHLTTSFETQDGKIIVYDPARNCIVVFEAHSNGYLMDVVGEICWLID